MTKEAKKAKPSLTKLEEANTDTPVLVLEGEVIPAVKIVEDKNTGAIDEIADSDGISFGGFVKKEGPGFRRCVDSVKDKPLLIVAGSEVELTKLDHVNIYRVGGKVVGRKLKAYHDMTNNNVLSLPGSGLMYRMTPYETEVLTNSECEWWTATVRDVEIIMSSGSELFVDSELMTGYEHSYRDRETESNPKLTLIGAKLDCKTLSVAGDVVVNNSQIVSNYVDLVESSISASHLSAHNGAINVTDTVLSSSSIHDTRNISIRESELISVSLSGGSSIQVRKGLNFGGLFSLGLYSKHELGMSLSGELHTFSAFQHIGNKQLPSNDTYYQSNINISRRVDYGVFNAVGSLPFTRLNDFDILVNGEVFLAKEFYPEYFTKETKPSSDVVSPFTPSYMQAPACSWANLERGGVLWERAAKIAFRYNTKVIGKAGNDIVKALLEAIRSRVGLYIEIYNLEP